MDENTVDVDPVWIPRMFIQGCVPAAAGLAPFFTGRTTLVHPWQTNPLFGRRREGKVIQTKPNQKKNSSSFLLLLLLLLFCSYCLS